MSVRVSDRNTSKCEYVYNAFQLSNLVNERMTKYCNKIANDKRYKHFTKSSYYGIWKSPILFASKVYYYCQCANKMRVQMEYCQFFDNGEFVPVTYEQTAQKRIEEYHKRKAERMAEVVDEPKEESKPEVLQLDHEPVLIESKEEN